MPNMQLFAAQVLEHVDVDRWQRPAALLQLLTHLAPDGQAVPLRAPDLMFLQARSPSGARHDQRWLVRLADDGVLHHWAGAGRRPTVWAINPRVSEWRHVPWLTPQRQVVRLLGRPLVRPLRAVVGQNPWSEPRLVRQSPPQTEASENLTSTFIPLHYRTTARDYRTTARPERESEPRLPHYRAPEPAPCPSSRETSSLSSPLEERSGEETPTNQPTSDVPGRLRAALSMAMSQPIYGAMAAQLHELEVRCTPPQLESLLARCKAHAGTRMIRVAVADLQACALALIDTPTANPGRRAAVLRRLIATKRELGVDTTDEETQLAQLERRGHTDSAIG